jgi:hypothetical protein
VNVAGHVQTFSTTHNAAAITPALLEATLRRLLVPFTVVALALTTTSLASAHPDGVQPNGTTDPGILALITNDDLFSTADLSLVLAPAAPMGMSNGTQHYGPYTTNDTDSGCNIDPWNTETFDRHFTVRANGDGTFTVVEQFKNGDFVTVGSQSPGEQCPENNDPTGVATVDAGIPGSMHGYFIITNVTGPQTSHDPNCNATTHDNTGCNTATFIDTHFTPCYGAGICTVPTFVFHYAAGDQGLIEHEWKNASADRGGNHGDIASFDPD